MHVRKLVRCDNFVICLILLLCYAVCVKESKKAEPAPDLMLRVRSVVREPSNFVSFPALRALRCPVRWDGSEALSKLVGKNAFLLPISVQLVGRKNWVKIIVENIVDLPEDARVSFVGRFSQNFGVISSESIVSKTRLRKLLNDNRVVQWVVNQKPVLKHPKINVRLLGVNNFPVQNVVEVIWKRADEKKFERVFTMSVVHQPRDGDELRTQLVETARRFESHDFGLLAQNACGGDVKQNRCFDPYVDMLLQSKMVISPPGLGFDTHRTSEILAAGCVPVVQSSNMDSAFQGLPVLIVEDLLEAVFDYKRLLVRYDQLMRKDFRLDYLTNNYIDKNICN